MSVLSVFPGGGGTKLNVTACASAGSLPAGADEGDIAVITSTAIGDSYANTAFPASPAPGDVFLLLGGLSYPIPLTGQITLHPRAAYQYVGSAWVLKDVYIYISGAWVLLSFLLYKTGTFYMGNGFSLHSQSRTALSLRSADIQFRFYVDDPNGGAYIWAYTTYSVNLTGINRIRMTYSRSESRISGKAVVASSRSTSYAAATSMPGTFNTGTPYTIDINVSALSGNYYIGAYFSVPYLDMPTQYGYIYKIEFL